MFKWPDGRIYDGEFLNDLKHGYGIYSVQESNEKYLGNWNHGNLDQQGFLFKDGVKKKGEWKNG